MKQNWSNDNSTQLNLYNVLIRLHWLIVRLLAVAAAACYHPRAADVMEPAYYVDLSWYST